MACKTHGQLSRQGPDCRMLAPMPRPAPTVHVRARWIAQDAKQWRVQDAPTTSQAMGAHAPWAANANSASPTSCDTLSGTPGRLSAGLPKSLPHVSPMGGAKPQYKQQQHEEDGNNMPGHATTCRVTQSTSNKDASEETPQAQQATQQQARALVVYDDDGPH